MNSMLKKCCMAIVFSVLCLFLFKTEVNAYGKNEVYIIDEADLFTDEEKDSLKHIMYDVSEYGHVALVTSDYV